MVDFFTSFLLSCAKIIVGVARLVRRQSLVDPFQGPL